MALVLLVERVEQVRHHLFLGAASLTLAVLVGQMHMAVQQARVVQAVGLRVLLVALEPLVQQIVEAEAHLAVVRQAALAALAS